MLVNLRDILAIAEQNNTALVAFNTPSLEAVRAALDAAEAAHTPLIIAHAEAHDAFAPLKTMGRTMIALAEESSLPVCVHLDHAEHLSYIAQALDMGFTGVMYDGSYLTYQENLKNSRAARAMCNSFDVGLECEIGSMGSREAGYKAEGGTAQEAGAIYTDPAQALEFIQGCGCDALACSFGTVHGIYKGKPQLKLSVLEDIRKNNPLPLVMHGGSGVSDDDYRRCIKAGIRKINYYTYGVLAAGAATSELARAKGSEPLYWHDCTETAYQAMFKDFSHILNVCSKSVQD